MVSLESALDAGRLAAWHSEPTIRRSLRELIRKVEKDFSVVEAAIPEPTRRGDSRCLLDQDSVTVRAWLSVRDRAAQALAVLDESLKHARIEAASGKRQDCVLTGTNDTWLEFEWNAGLDNALVPVHAVPCMNGKCVGPASRVSNRRTEIFVHRQHVLQSKRECSLVMWESTMTLSVPRQLGLKGRLESPSAPHGWGPTIIPWMAGLVVALLSGLLSPHDPPDAHAPWSILGEWLPAVVNANGTWPWVPMGALITSGLSIQLLLKSVGSFRHRSYFRGAAALFLLLALLGRLFATHMNS